MLDEALCAIAHSMTVNPVEQLSTFGPDRCEMLGVEQARAWCRKLTHGHYENFSVLSALVPLELRDDFAAVYAFCRWADDLGDEVGDRARSLELLAWWRDELRRCFDGEPRHPVFVALRPTVEKHDLPMKPFDDLIAAFEQDQTVTRYETWDQVVDYCRRSADPVGRLVLMVCGEPRTDELFGLSDCICTALQLTNHWQDVRRDILERDRIYIPRELNRIENFEERLIASARQGYAVDREFLDQSRQVIRECVNRTWPLYEEGQALLPLLHAGTRPVVRLLAGGGQRVLHLIEQWGYETVLHRPRLSKWAKLMLVGRELIAARFGRNGATAA